MSVDVERLIGDLAARVERLEQAERSRAQAAGQGARRFVEGLSQEDAGTPGEATIGYAGAGPWGTGAVAWQMNRTWDEVRGAAGERSAALFSALASPTRVRIVAELLGGGLTTAELTRRLDQPSSGQLFHHLKELLAAGVIHQPVRGTYAVREHRVIPLLALLAAADDINPGAVHADPA
ncbi:MAG TPA: helix-turn-helix domain-containing protein [Pilimelia sp.]|nr:helix-turn-helix domain-containing protein [Pilimelia sp.]